MKYLDEFADPDLARHLLDRIRAITTRPWAIMEVCGGQTHAIVKLRHRPAVARGDRAHPRSRVPGLRHPGGDDRQGPRHRRPARGHLLLVRGHAAGAGEPRGPLRGQGARAPTCAWSIRPWTPSRSPGPTPSRQVVFFGVGFETTAPANAMAVHQAASDGSRQLLDAGLPRPGAAGHRGASWSRPDCRVQGFLAAGHVCAVMGTGEYPDRWPPPGPDRGHRVRALDILEGIRTVRRPARGRPGRGREAYARAVRQEGNLAAQETDARGLRVVRPLVAGHRDDPAERLGLTDDYHAYDAEDRIRRRLDSGADESARVPRR